MPRFARLHAPGALVHVIARFVNRDHRLAGPEERAAVLERIPAAMARCDWSVHAYALMSNHLHLAVIAGMDPPWRLLKPLHIAIARWLNRTQGTLGPVFAGRATTVVMAPERMAVLAAYIHNNPVRAGLVREAAGSSWSSHRAWLGIEPAPGWLGVERGLALAGFEASGRGRGGFDEWVAARRGDPRDPDLSGLHLATAQRRVRASLALPVDLASPQERGGAGLASTVLLRGPAAIAPRWDGDLRVLLQRVSEHTAVSVEELCARSHRPAAVRARRLALVAGAWLLRRDVKEVAAALGISGTAGSHLLRRTDGLLPAAMLLADQVRS
jgi:REP element-mobilizing transposase RayT